MMNNLKALARRTLYSPALAKWMHRYNEWKTAQNAEEPPSVDENGLPIPDSFLMTVVAGQISWEFFLKGGRSAIETFADAVDRNGGDFQNAERILDFGCGCGRLARHAPALTEADFYGVDYNGRLVGWCAENLPGHFSQNKLHPPLDFPDGHFDVIYLLSVFTHLRIPTQDAWLTEFKRVTKPGGYCLVTFHDEDHPNMGMTDISRETLLRHGTAIYNDKAEGSNYISTFQTREFSQTQFSRFFEVKEIIRSVDNPINQAIAVLQRRA